MFLGHPIPQSDPQFHMLQKYIVYDASNFNGTCTRSDQESFKQKLVRSPEIVNSDLPIFSNFGSREKISRQNLKYQCKIHKSVSKNADQEWAFLDDWLN